MGAQFSIPVRMQPIGFLFASRPLITGQVLGIVYRVISMYLVKKAGYSQKTARTPCPGSSVGKKISHRSAAVPQANLFQGRGLNHTRYYHQAVLKVGKQ